MHSSLATNSRLVGMGISQTGDCDKCGIAREQTSLHLFYECRYISPLYFWILDILMYICNFRPDSNIKFLFFDSSYSNVFQQRICNMFVAMYVSTVWRNRKENLRIGILKKKLISNVIECIELRKHLTKQSSDIIFGEYYQKLYSEELKRFLE